MTFDITFKFPPDILLFYFNQEESVGSRVQVISLSRRFAIKQGGHFNALDTINFTVEPGEIFGIVGMSGAGKSTLLRLLATLDEPTSGSILIDDQDTSTLFGSSLNFLRRKMGMVFQDLYLFSSKTTLENITFPLEMTGLDKNAQLEKAHELLSMVGLSGKENKYPMKLSGGERQRVAIARALARSPSLLLLDEMTSALDPKTKRSILDLLLELNRTLSLTIILITHEMEVVRRICNRVAILDHGNVVEEGTVEDLFARAKHPVTKELIQHIDHELPKDIAGDLWLLTFLGEAAKKPLLTTLIRDFKVEVNILLGSIDRIRSGEIGRLVVAISGPLEERTKALVYLSDRGVIAEALPT